MYPWQKTADALRSAQHVLRARVGDDDRRVHRVRSPPEAGAACRPALVATTAGASGDARVFGGGHIVAERKYADGVRDLVDGWTERIVNARAAHPLALLCTIVFFFGAAATAVRFIADPRWAHFGWYAAYVFAISLCLRQVGKFARLATADLPGHPRLLLRDHAPRLAHHAQPTRPPSPRAAPPLTRRARPLHIGDGPCTSRST